MTPMNTTFYSLKNTYDYLEGLDIHPELNALWEIIHIVRWHKGIDWIMWISHNKDLIEEIVVFQNRIDFPEDLKGKVVDSILKIKRIDR